MKKCFYASACINGLHGGGIYLDDTEFCFRCHKTTIVDEYKNLHIPYKNIKAVANGKRILFFPTAVIETMDRNIYRFLIFNRNKFIRYIVNLLQQSV